MSQAHYERCSWFAAEWQCPDLVVARLHVRARFGPPSRPVCPRHLNAWLDQCDDRISGLTFREEPTKIEWLWDAGTRTCPLHHWPDVLCRDWGAEHAAMLRRQYPRALST